VVFGNEHTLSLSKRTENLSDKNGAKTTTTQSQERCHFVEGRVGAKVKPTSLSKFPITKIIDFPYLNVMVFVEIFIRRNNRKVSKK
jgi:hypothetical protein